jgi:hypothetical protein
VSIYHYTITRITVDDAPNTREPCYIPLLTTGCVTTPRWFGLYTRKVLLCTKTARRKTRAGSPRHSGQPLFLLLIIAVAGSSRHRCATSCNQRACVGHGQACCGSARITTRTPLQCQHPHTCWHLNGPTCVVGICCHSVTHECSCVVGGGDTPQTLCYPAPISLSSITHVGVTAQSTVHSRLHCGMRARVCVCAKFHARSPTEFFMRMLLGLAM